MKAKLQFPVDTLTGKTAPGSGLVGFIWRGVQVFRSYAVPRNPQSVEQVSIRAYLAAASINYKTCTPAEKANWTDYAAGKRVMVNGKSIQLPEISLYDNVNVIRQISGAAIDNAAPLVACPVSVTGITTATYDSVTGEFVLNITHSTLSTSAKVMVKVTPALSSQITTPKKSSYRLVKGVDSASIVSLTVGGSSELTFTDPVITWTVPKYIGVKITPISSDGDLGVEYETVIQVVAP